MEVVTFCMNIPWKHNHGWTPVCCVQAKIETKDGSRNVNRFVYKPTKWMTNSKALVEALGKRCSNSNEPPFHRHIVLNGGLAKMATTYEHSTSRTLTADVG